MTVALTRRGFLAGARPETAPWFLAERCLAMRAIYCRSCADACPHGAIRIRPALGGRAEFVLDAQACQGCGDCARACPAEALRARQEKEQTDA